MKYHFIGIKGSGMSALAQIMFDLGNEVQGSDVTNHLFTQDVLEEKNIKMLPFDSKNITNDMIIVRGGAFRDDHPEVIEAKRIGAPMYTYFELLGNLTAQYETIAVCGDHGKTTTTALATHVFKDLVGTNYLIGDGTGYASRDNQYFIIEACEHKRHFLHYFPKYIIMTNIEWDHVDYYKDLDDIKEAYQTFCEKAEKQIIACGDDNNIRSITIDKPILYYGFNDNNDVIAKNVEYLGNGSSFDVYMKDDYLGNYFTPLQGKHMVLNATAVLALAHLIGLDLDKVKDLFKTFKGARRRFVEKKSR